LARQAPLFIPGQSPSTPKALGPHPGIGTGAGGNRRSGLGDEGWRALEAAEIPVRATAHSVPSQARAVPKSRGLHPGNRPDAGGSWRSGYGCPGRRQPALKFGWAHDARDHPGPTRADGSHGQETAAGSGSLRKRPGTCLAFTPSPSPSPHPHCHRRRRGGSVAAGPRRARSGLAGPDRNFCDSTQRRRSSGAAAWPSGVAACAVAASPQGLDCGIACAVPRRAVRGGADPSRQAARAGAAPRN
jgi:hypothetical protein